MGCGRVGAPRPRDRTGRSRGRRHRPGRGRVPAAGRELRRSHRDRAGFDRNTLRAAGIDKAYAFAAVSSGDNSNILAARVAREKYGVEIAVAWIYDPGRAEIYQWLGIPTVATVKWTSDQIMRRLLLGPRPGVHRPLREGGHRRDARCDGVDRARWGHRGRHRGSARVITRLGDGLLPGPDTVYQDGDLLHLALRREDLATAGTGPRHRTARPLTPKGQPCASSSPEPAVGQVHRPRAAPQRAPGAPRGPRGGR